jgi:hypothetical protein
VPCSGRLVLLPYPELINARDSKTLCAMALYGKPASQPIARSLHRRFIPSQGALPCPALGPYLVHLIPRQPLHP